MKIHWIIVVGVNVPGVRLFIRSLRYEETIEGFLNV